MSTTTQLRIRKSPARDGSGGHHAAAKRTPGRVRRGIRAVIPQPSDHVGHRLRRGNAGGRTPAFYTEAYKQRNAVERCVNRLKQWRGLAMRTDKRAIAYQTTLHLTATLLRARRQTAVSDRPPSARPLAKSPCRRSASRA